MTGQFRPLSDVRQGEATPPVAKAFTMSVAPADALDAMQCTLEHSFGGSPTAPPKASRPPCERPSPVPPISSVREEKAKATLSQISSLNFRIPGSTQSRLPTLVDSKFSSEFCFPKYLIVEK
jgi:hypothetical protein